MNTAKELGGWRRNLLQGRRCPRAVSLESQLCWKHGVTTALPGLRGSCLARTALQLCANGAGSVLRGQHGSCGARTALLEQSMAVLQRGRCWICVCGDDAAGWTLLSEAAAAAAAARLVLKRRARVEGDSQSSAVSYTLNTHRAQL